MKVFRDFMRFYSVPLVLLAGLLCTAAFTVFYTYTAQTQTGAIISNNWPKTFTLAFSRHIVSVDDIPAVTEEGQALLDDNGLWLQVLDAAGRQVIQYQKPPETPDAYQPYALLQTYQHGSGQYSVFISRAEVAGVPYTYLIGFPFSISKVTTYVDSARYRSGKVLIVTVLALTAVLVVTLTVYSYKTFLAAEKRRRQDEKAKEEWLANITHDLKTPLAPICGYAELLAEGEMPPAQDVRRYGAVLLKNALYTEQLVDDLKLTYQLQSGMLPLLAEEQSMARFLRELVIDILNTPEYEQRRITFLADREDRRYCFDARLLRRAVTNVIINSLKHNAAGTEITVSLSGGPGVQITLADNGSGMTSQELAGLFTRYYRGTSTQVKSEGSGLGMAIARQIVEAHGGVIRAQSAPGMGTTITICLP